MKKVARVLIVLLLISLIPVFMSDQWAARYVVKKIEKATGFKATLEHFHVGIIKPVITIRNLILTNPPEFPHPEAITIGQLSVGYNRMSLLGRELRLNHLVVDIPRVVMVKPERGPSNIELLSKMGEQEEAGQRKPEETRPESAPPSDKPKQQKKDKVPRTLAIDTMKVKMGEMEVRQYVRNQAKPSVITLPVNFDRTYHNVTNLETVAVQMTTELVLQSSVAFLGRLGSLLNDSSESNSEQRKQMKEQLKNLKQLFK